ncbi:MAG TPA: hypothetical protein VK736_03745 [Candidatus Binatia bacterium]|nr:hypothetical protein [Candidatus Binatia bacterium]
MPRTERALSRVAKRSACCSIAAATVTLLAGLAANPATARPDPGQTATEQSTGAVSDQSQFARFRCAPIDTGVYDPMQDYVETLIWWYYHPDWRVA